MTVPTIAGVALGLALASCGRSERTAPASAPATPVVEPAPATAPTPAPLSPPTTRTPSAMPTPSLPKATTRDEAFAIALAAVQAAHPSMAFSLREELSGGGVNGPWVFVITPTSTSPGDQIPGLGPVLVHYHGTAAVFLRPDPRGARHAVNAWEIETYGHLQR